MSRIAYIDHSYHKTTVSTQFLPELLLRFGHDVAFFWDESWRGGKHINWTEVSDYDVVIMFQSIAPINATYYKSVHPNVIFIPMLDQFGIWQGPMFNLAEFFNPFHGSKVLNFSNALHGLVTGLGIQSKVVRFYQPAEEASGIPTQGLHGFLWTRREHEISWNTIKTLIEGARFDSLHIHLANDPDTVAPTRPSADDVRKYNITMSTWFDDKNDFRNTLKRANVYFAPRMEEGIGQSFLEAFSLGQCVVAPNNGTMNEYIIHGINGLLYDAFNPSPLHFDNALVLGERGKEAADIGYLTWESQTKELVDFILKPSSEFYVGKYQHDFNRAGPQSLRSKLRHLSQYNYVLRKTKRICKPIYNRFK